MTFEEYGLTNEVLSIVQSYIGDTTAEIEVKFNNIGT